MFNSNVVIIDLEKYNDLIDKINDCNRIIRELEDQLDELNEDYLSECKKNILKETWSHNIKVDSDFSGDNWKDFVSYDVSKSYQKGLIVKVLEELKNERFK